MTYHAANIRRWINIEYVCLKVLQFLKTNEPNFTGKRIAGLIRPSGNVVNRAVRHDGQRLSLFKDGIFGAGRDFRSRNFVLFLIGIRIKIKISLKAMMILHMRLNSDNCIVSFCLV